MRASIILLACLLGFINAATDVRIGFISFNGDVLTSNGDGFQVTMEPLGVCQATQEWVWDSDGYIYQRSNKSLVLDVRDSSTNNGAQVIMWNKKPAGADARNQLWDVYSDRIQSRLTGTTYGIRKSIYSKGVVNSNNQPLQAFTFMQSPYNCPSTCTSHGDPHFYSWNGKKFDFQSANTVLLANFTGARVYAVQYPCNTGVTCNEGFVVHPTGTNNTFQLTFGRAYFNRTLTNVSMGTTSFGSFINVTKWSSTQYSINVPGGFINYAIYTNWVAPYVNIDVTITNGVPAASLCWGPNATQSAHSFGSQFLVMQANQTAYVYSSSSFSYNPNYVPNYGPYTTDDQALMTNATRLCGILSSPSGPFAQCNQLVDPSFWQGTCYNDSIAMGSLAFVRGSVDAYAKQCAQAAARNGTTVVLPTSSAATTVVNNNPSVPTNTMQWFTIVSKDATFMNRTMGGDMYWVNSTGPAPVMTTIVDNMNGTYTVWYNLTAEGTYTFQVWKDGMDEVGNSPLNITAVAMTSAAASSFVFGPVPMGTTQMFTVQARTASGAVRTMGGDAITASITNGSITNIMDKGDGTYVVSYVANMSGPQKISVMYMGQQIGCSPYTVNVM